MIEGRQGSAIRSGAYVVAGSLAVKILSVVRAVVVARLLVPEEVGRFALAAAALTALDAVTDPGVVAALIQRRDQSVATIQVAWTMLVVRGVALSGLLLAVAPAVASLVRAPEIVGPLRVLSVLPILHACASLAPALAERRLDLRPSMLIELVSFVVESVVTVAVAAATRSLSGLVAGTLAGTVAGTACSYLVRGFRPALRFRRAELGELVKFGRWVSVSNTLNFVAVTGDDLLVGRWAGVRPVGLYRVAYRFANIPTTEVTHVLARVAFPLFAQRHRDRDAETQSAFRRSLVLVSGVSAPAAVLLAVLAGDLVAALLGPAWVGAATALSFLAAGGYLRSIVATGGPLFLAVGRPQLDTAMQAVRAVVLLAALVVLVPRWGIKGAAVASTLSLVAIVPVWLAGLRQSGIDALDSGRAALRRLPAALAGGAAAAAVSYLLPGPVRGLLGGALSGGAAWAAWAWRWDGALWDELRRLPQGLRAATTAAGSAPEGRAHVS